LGDFGAAIMAASNIIRPDHDDAVAIYMATEGGDFASVVYR